MIKTLFKVTEYAKTDFIRVDSPTNLLVPVAEDIFETEDEAIVSLKAKWIDKSLDYNRWYGEMGYHISLESDTVATLTTVEDGLIGLSVLTPVYNHTN